MEHDLIAELGQLIVEVASFEFYLDLGNPGETVT